MRITFKVKRSWIGEQNIDEVSVTISRFNPDIDVWETLPTQKERVGDEHVYYSATSEGLMLFAISGAREEGPPEIKILPIAVAIAIAGCVFGVLLRKRKTRR